MQRNGLLGLAALVVALHATTALAQTPVERGGYLVNTVMTCQNCHTPMGPNGPQFDKALSGGLRFDEPPFDVTAPSRCNFSAGAEAALHCFDMVYPQREQRAWDAIVTRISRSLRPLERGT